MTRPILPISVIWAEQAEQNAEKWGEQDVDTLLLAMQEELGELTQAHLEARAENGDVDRISDELRDLAALCYQLQWRLTGHLGRYPPEGQI